MAADLLDWAGDRVIVWNAAERSVLARLNAGSIERSFVPSRDVPWEHFTSDGEWLALYHAWSLFPGSRFESEFSDEMRANFARYQQSSLMLATAMLERHVLPVLEELLELSQEPEFVEFVAHFIKEESYHYVMFTRSIDKIETEMPALPPLPKARTEVPLRTIFWLLRLVPGRRLRIAISLTVLHFAEQVSVHASAVARGAAPRQDSFVPQVWALHAIDEGRHLQFDRLLLDKLATSRAMRRTARLAALPFCLVCTLTIHRNEAWAARQLGVRVRLRHLLGLLRSPASEFKQRVVKLIRDVAFESPRGA